MSGDEGERKREGDLLYDIFGPGGNEAGLRGSRKIDVVAARPPARRCSSPAVWKLPVIRSRRGPASPGPSARFFRRALSSPRRPDDASALRGGPVAMVKPLKGVVVSNSMMKSVTVMVERLYKHPRWGKYVRGRKKYMVRPARNARNAPAARPRTPRTPRDAPGPGTLDDLALATPSASRGGTLNERIARTSRARSTPSESHLAPPTASVPPPNHCLPPASPPPRASVSFSGARRAERVRRRRQGRAPPLAPAQQEQEVGGDGGAEEGARVREAGRGPRGEATPRTRC